MIGGLPDSPRREVVKAKDGWHVVEHFYNGIHPDYRSVAGPFKAKAEAKAALGIPNG